jgi:hypothetical protein
VIKNNEMKIISTYSIDEYIEKNQKRSLVHWKIEDGVQSFMHNDRWYNEKEFDMIYPAYEFRRFNEKGVNPDKRKVV